MATIRHPVTGVELNSIDIRRSAPLTEAEHRTARLLIAEGHQRWAVAGMLGCFPLAFEGNGRRPTDSRKPTGGNLSRHDARRDPRQTAMPFALPEDLAPKRG